MMEKPISRRHKRNQSLISDQNSRQKQKRKSKMDASTKFLLAISGFLALCTIVTSAPNTNVTTVLCNSGVYSKGDPFGTSLDYIVTELETVTPTLKRYDYYNISPYPNALAYGHAACNQNLTSPDCGTCLAAAKTVMFQNCQSRIGARSVLHDCTIRYEQYPFTD